ncbi:MAG: glycosyltransferase family 4 protein [Pyrinomonadaceae bacterium]
MRTVLLVLSGDPNAASETLKARYPDCEIVSFQRVFLENGSMSDRLSTLRKMEPDVFAIMTESLDWQFGQQALMLLGALAGANESLIIDARRNICSGKRFSLIAKAPFQIARSFVRGKSAVGNAAKTLNRLEQLVNSHKSNSTILPTKNSPVSVTYLRATPAAGTQPGGATSHINGVVNAMLSFGANVTFISNDEIAGLDKNKITFHKIAPDPDIMPRSGFDIFNGAAFALAATDLIAASPPDFIYQRYCRFSWAGVEASLLTNVPLFLEYNGSEVWVGKHWDKTDKLDLLERCERLNLQAASRVFVISEVEKNNLLNLGIPSEKLIVNPNGVDTDEFRPDVGGKKTREELGFGEDKILVGFLGTFGPWHGVLALADAIALTPKNNNIHFLLIGDGSLRTEVEKKLRDSGELDRVTCAGVVRHDRVPAFLDACDILVSPHVPLADGSEFFGSPTKLFEYMAMGKAIVASRLGQIGDVLTDNETALLVEPGNAKELSDAIIKLANDHELASRLGKAARSTAIAKHRWSQNAARILNATS